MEVILNTMIRCKLKQINLKQQAGLKDLSILVNHASELFCVCSELLQLAPGVFVLLPGPQSTGMNIVYC